MMDTCRCACGRRDMEQDTVWSYAAGMQHSRMSCHRVDALEKAVELVSVEAPTSHFLQGQINGYDLEGSGPSLKESLEAYARQCRKTAEQCRQEARALDIEANRAENAAMHCGLPGDA